MPYQKMYEGSGFIPNFQEETSNVENIQLQQLDLQSDPQPLDIIQIPTHVDFFTDGIK